MTALPRPPVVVAISAETSIATVADLVAAGAVGYLAKGRLGDTLPELLSRCVAGEVVLAAPTAAAALRILLPRDGAALVPAAAATGR